MSFIKSKISRVATLGLTGALLLGTAGCPEAAQQIAGEAAEICGIECGDLSAGNASITGVVAVDGFFGAVVRFDETATSVSADIDAELSNIYGAFGVDSAAALDAKLSANVDGDISFEYQPARCEVDARASIEANFECQASVGCEADYEPGSVEFECKGSCEVDVMADIGCSAEATLECSFAGPAVACEGVCEGECSAEGSTETMMAGGSCSGTCNGTCTVSGPEVDCTGAVSARCTADVDANVMCSGRCDGEFTPPSVMVDCMAAASCEASAKAEASLNVECTPPRVDIEYTLVAGIEAEAQAEIEGGLYFLRDKGMPNLLASLEKSTRVLDAGVDLAAEAGGSLSASFEVIADGDLTVVQGLKLATCGTEALRSVGGVIDEATGRLDVSVAAAAELQAMVGI